MNKCQENRGITLAETLFSIGILALVLTGILFIFVQTMDMSKRIDYEYTATNLAKSRIERARGFIETSGFSSLTPENFNETDKLLDSHGNPDTNGDFKRSTTVTTNHDGDASLTRLDTTVIYRYRNEWKDSAAITMTTIFTSAG